MVAIGLAPQLFAVAQDQEFAQVAGLNVRLYNLLVAVMAAVTVTVAMRTVGLLLVSALMVVPVATAQQVTRAFRTTLVAAMALGMLASVGGVVVSSYVSFGVDSLGVARARRSCCWRWPASRRRTRSGCGCGDGSGWRLPFVEPADPFPLSAEHTAVPEDHGHEHGQECGHPAVPHGDHVDYVHDGHRHAPHGSHYDEH